MKRPLTLRPAPLTVGTIVSVQAMRFEWDENKNASNRRKHEIDFETARLVFEDAFHVTDEAKTVKSEKRWITVGSVEGIIIVAVLHTDRGRPPDEAIRIMSASCKQT